MFQSTSTSRTCFKPREVLNHEFVLEGDTVVPAQRTQAAVELQLVSKVPSLASWSEVQR